MVPDGSAVQDFQCHGRYERDERRREKRVQAHRERGDPQAGVAAHESEAVGYRPEKASSLRAFAEGGGSA